jgi:hypothetical protein
MDLREVVGVVRKRWIIGLVGLVLAIVAGYETYAHRAASQYSSNATIFVTQGDYTSMASVNSGTLTGLAYLYAQVAQSDLIRRKIGAPPNSIAASVITTGSFSTGAPLPFIYLTTLANSGMAALTRTDAATVALQRYVNSNQSSTSKSQRVNLQVITAPVLGKSITPRTRVLLLPLVVFLTIVLATLGLMFIVENLTRPRELSETPASTSDRRSRWLPRGGAEADEPRGDEPAISSKLLRQQ